jgi:glycosyltransferase involved in cell wall biosynthesis
MPSILLITVAYPPSRLIGGRRPARMAMGLQALGWQVTVATLHPAYMAPLDAEGPPTPGIEILRSHALMPRVWLRRDTPAATAPSPPPAAPSPKSAARPQQSWRSALGRMLRQVEFPDDYAGWLPLALAQLRGRRFDVVLATLPPPTDALIGALAAKLCGAKLVLDYRDPWTEVMTADGSYGLDRAFPPAEIALHRALEDRILRQAALVLAVTPKMTRWLAARTTKPVEFLPNGLDATPPATPLPRDQPLRLVYAGSLAYARSLDSVLAAIALLRQQFPPDKLRLTYAGPHGAELLRAAESHGVAAWIDNRGQLPNQQALQLYRGAAAGIVSVSARTDYSYPGKLFEILSAGCPILLCGPNDCDAAQLVRELAAGVVDDGADPQRSAVLLEACLTSPPRALTGLQDWLAPVQVAKLDALLRNLL